MKLKISALFVFLIISFLCSCAFVADKKEEGSLCVTLPGKSSRAVSADDAAFYEAVLIKGEYTYSYTEELSQSLIIKDITVKSGETIYFEDLTPGVYTVALAAFAEDSTVPFATGFATATVAAGEAVSLLIKMKAYSSPEPDTPEISGCTTLEQFISCLDSGELEITIASSLVLTDRLTISLANDVVIRGSGGEAGFDGNGSYSIVIEGNSHSLTLSGLTFKNGYRGSGAGGMINASGIDCFEVSDCTFTNNTISRFRSKNGQSGGAIYTSDCALIDIKDCNFTFEDGSDNNSSACAGGFVYIENDCSNVTIENSSFTGGYASHGGALGLRVSTTVRGCTFINNYADYAGGAINTGDKASITIDGCIFYSSNYGGMGQYVYTCGASASISNCTNEDSIELDDSICYNE